MGAQFPERWQQLRDIGLVLRMQHQYQTRISCRTKYSSASARYLNNKQQPCTCIYKLQHQPSLALLSADIC